jgi:hypothetical protein
VPSDVLVVDVTSPVGLSVVEPLFRAAGVRTWVVTAYEEEDDVTFHPSEAADELPKSYLLVLWHQSSRSVWDEKLKLRAGFTAALSLWYTTASPELLPLSISAREGIKRQPLTESKPLGEADVLDLLAFARAKARGQSASVPVVMTWLTRQPERLMALSILCQGYLASNALRCPAEAPVQGPFAEALNKMGWWEAHERIRDRVYSEGLAESLGAVDGRTWWLEAFGGNDLQFTEATSVASGLRFLIEAEMRVAVGERSGIPKLLRWLTEEELEICPDDVGRAYCEIMSLLETLGAAG